jgi:hypothetical protein
MRVVTESNWITVSRLLDEALDLEPAARSGWLESLRRAQPDVAPALERLLAAHAHVETSALLQTLPQLDRAAALRVGPARRTRRRWPPRRAWSPARWSARTV